MSQNDLILFGIGDKFVLACMYGNDIKYEYWQSYSMQKYSGHLKRLLGKKTHTLYRVDGNVSCFVVYLATEQVLGTIYAFFRHSKGSKYI